MELVHQSNLSNKFEEEVNFLLSHISFLFFFFFSMYFFFVLFFFYFFIIEDWDNKK